MKKVHLAKSINSQLPVCRNGSHRIRFIVTLNPDRVTCDRCKETAAFATAGLINA